MENENSKKETTPKSNIVSEKKKNEETKEQKEKRSETKSSLEPKVKNKKTNQKTSSKNTGSAFWAFLLISAGLILILNNFGILPWSIWSTLLKLWPLALVLPGLQLILGNSWIATLIITIVGIGTTIIISALSLASQNENINNWLEKNIPWITENIQISYTSEEINKTLTINKNDYSDINERVVSMDLGAGNFTLTDSKKDYYLESESTYHSGIEEPNIQSSKTDDLLEIDFYTESQPFNFGSINNSFTKTGHLIDIGQPEIITTLNIDLGAGNVTTTLDDILVKNIELKIGAGTAKINISETSLPREKLIVDVSAGKATITLPENTEIKVIHDTGVGVLKIGNKTITTDGIYTSENYSKSAQKIELELEVGAGSCKIEFE